MSDFSQLIVNLNQQGKPWERTLGGKGNRDALAKFHEQFPDVFQTIAVRLMYDFVTMNEFSKDQWVAYQRGIADVGMALDSCLKEYESDKEKKPE